MAVYGKPLTIAYHPETFMSLSTFQMVFLSYWLNLLLCLLLLWKYFRVWTKTLCCPGGKYKQSSARLCRDRLIGQRNVQIGNSFPSTLRRDFVRQLRLQLTSNRSWLVHTALVTQCYPLIRYVYSSLPIQFDSLRSEEGQTATNCSIGNIFPHQHKMFSIHKLKKKKKTKDLRSAWRNPSGTVCSSVIRSLPGSIA